MARCCGEGGCTCLVEAGAGIEVVGTGARNNPYVVTASGTVDDAIVAGYVADPDSATRAAADDVYVLEGSAFADIGKRAGVDPTGVTECAAAIQAALDGILTAGLRAYAKGTFKIGSTVTIKGAVDLGDATFNWTGPDTGTAVQVGNGLSGGTGILFRKQIVLPHVINTVKVGTGWTGSSVGIKAVNTYACSIVVPRVKGFVTGYYAYALGTGNVYNDVHLLHADNNKRQLVLGAGTGGWSNSNTYRLGILAHESAEGSNVSGTRDILCESATNIVNGNLFLGGSVEGDTAEYHLDCDGLYNRFEEVRWENATGCRVIWRANAARNVITYGYGAQGIIETHVSGSVLNRIFTTGMSRIVGSTSKAVQWLENSGSSTLAVDAVMDPGASVAGSDAATAYRVYRTADSTKMKRATDVGDRLILDHTNGRVYLGPGTGAPTIYLGMLGASTIGVNGSGIAWLTDNTYDIGLVSTFRPRDIHLGRDVRAGGVVKTGTGPTASRPAAGASGAGACWFDTTLGKPIVSDGTTWQVGLTGLSATATLDFLSIPGQGQQELTITVTGAAVGDSVALGPPATLPSGLQATGYVSAADTVRVRLSNITALPIDPASATWKVTVVR